jgi:hypothetical protein
MEIFDAVTFPPEELVLDLPVGEAAGWSLGPFVVGRRL